MMTEAKVMRAIACANAKEAAARAMLAALESARTYLGDDATDDSPEARATRADIDSAIAQARAAGVREIGRETE